MAGLVAREEPFLVPGLRFCVWCHARVARRLRYAGGIITMHPSSKAVNSQSRERA